MEKTFPGETGNKEVKNILYKYIYFIIAFLFEKVGITEPNSLTFFNLINLIQLIFSTSLFPSLLFGKVVEMHIVLTSELTKC